MSLDRASLRRKFTCAALVAVVTAGVAMTLPVGGGRALAQPPVLHTCRVFPVEFLRDCGAGSGSVDVKWFGPEGSDSFAAINTLPLAALSMMQEQQELFNKSMADDPAVTVEFKKLPVRECDDVRLSVVRKSGAPIMAYGVASCRRVTINYYAQMGIFASTGEAQFVPALQAVMIDIVENK